MNVDLTPGEWAGVLDAVRLRVKVLRAYEPEIGGPDDEAADDLDRIAGVIREAIADNGRELPELVPGEPGEEPLCPHVWTEDDVAKKRADVEAYNASLREQHGDAANLWVRKYPEVGTVCGKTLRLVEEGYDEVRNLVEWCEPTDDGVVKVGDSRFSDEGSGSSYVECDGGHTFAAPDIDYW